MRWASQPRHRAFHSTCRGDSACDPSMPPGSDNSFPNHCTISTPHVKSQSRTPDSRLPLPRPTTPGFPAAGNLECNPTFRGSAFPVRPGGEPGELVTLGGRTLGAGYLSSFHSFTVYAVSRFHTSLCAQLWHRRHDVRQLLSSPWRSSGP